MNNNKAEPTKNNIKYWQKRYTELGEITKSHEDQYIANMQQQFKLASKEISKKLDNFYRQFAHLENIDLQEAKRLLNSEELEEFHMSVEEYIETMHEYAETLDQDLYKKLERASLKYRVTRLEAIVLQLMCEASKAYDNIDTTFFTFLKDIYIDRYYRSVFTIFKGFGIGVSLSTLDMDALDLLLHKPWNLDGQDFSERIWRSKRRLLDNLETTLTQGLILGQSYTEMSERMQKLMRAESSKCSRIVTTEAAFFSSIAQEKSFNDLYVEQYQVVATLDQVTSEICRDMDLEVFDMNDFKPGETAPPFHPNCRTTTTPYYDDSDVPGYVVGERAARDKPEGKTYRVPADMNYWEWYDKHIAGTNEHKDKYKRKEPR